MYGVHGTVQLVTRTWNSQNLPSFELYLVISIDGDFREPQAHEPLVVLDCFSSNRSGDDVAGCGFRVQYGV